MNIKSISEIFSWNSRTEVICDDNGLPKFETDWPTAVDNITPLLHTGDQS